MLGASAASAVVAAVSLAGAPSAVAAGDYLEFSLDGMAYTPSITGPIFNEDLQYVPGGATGATIWIRNSSGEAARLASAAVMVRSDPQLDRKLGLAAGIDSDRLVRAALGGQGSCTDIPGLWDLGPGEELEMSLIADLSVDASNDTMNRSADFNVVFLLESKDAAPRRACDALPNEPDPAPMPGAPSAEAGRGSGSPSDAITGDDPSRLVTLPGTAGSSPGAASGGIFPAGMRDLPAAANSPQGVVPAAQQPPAAVVPAGFQSTVEPIIRSLSGTLLIAMSVGFTAAIILRIRNRSV
ncbi:hypothetical protein OL239_14815 [Arthrobacter sp. ATA002]|uniref:hypothetical protein n=1 Tax=Arthrobacter sp. ATA002 TaxID=2991715 RepID=UPI0022A7A9B3|nr:hypothetical protein [Arthrobacter sp. ATA002]WAP51139.1 hypothetical protein OL239_14815 [Arthrobacter sp. ATA002]